MNSQRSRQHAQGLHSSAPMEPNSQKEKWPHAPIPNPEAVSNWSFVYMTSVQSFNHAPKYRPDNLQQWPACKTCWCSSRTNVTGVTNHILIGFKIIFIFSVWVFCFHVCLCTTCMHGASWGQRTVSDPLELELQLVVSHHVDVENWTYVFWKNSQCC